MSQQDSNDTPKTQSAGSDKESMDRFTDPPESSDCSNHSTTDKDSEVSDSDSRLGTAGARSEASAMPQPSVRPRPAPLPYHQAATNSGPVGGVLAPSRLGNPFARVAPPVIRSSADSSEQRSGGGGGGSSGGGVSGGSGLLAPSRLGGGGGGAAVAVSSSRSVLRPSALSVPAASLKTPETNGLANSTFTLHPPKFNNPFAAKPAPEEDSEGSAAAPECASTETGGRRAAAAAAAAPSAAAAAAAAPSSTAAPSSAAAAAPTVHETVTSTSGSNGFTFQAAAAAPERRPEETESVSISSSSPSASGGFVFGQNLQERVTNASEAPPAVSSTLDEPAAAAEGATGEPAGDQASPASQPASGLSLRESAAVYEEQRSSKRKYDEVEVVTGEEDESNVLQINCKLYAFNKDNCSWLERGRGLLRLNDRREEGGGPLHSRLVFRTQGSLRLVLNTKIWPGMSVEKPSEKDVRVTAMDNDQVKVFLIKGTSKDAELLFNALDCRLSGLKAAEGELQPDAEAAAKKARQQEQAGAQR